MIKLLIVRGHFYRRNGLNTWEFLASNYSDKYDVTVIAANPTRHPIDDNLPYNIEQLLWLDGWLTLFNKRIIYSILRKLKLPVGYLVGLSKKCRKYDIVQVSENYTFFSFVAALFSKNLVVNTGENIPFPTFQHNLITLLLKNFINRKATAFITTTQAGRRALIHEGVPFEKVHIIPNSIICPCELLTNDLKNTYPKRVKFVFVGRLSEQKGISYLLEAFSNLKGEFESQLHLVGDDGERYRERFASVNFCYYHGKLQHNQVQSLLTSMDVLILPSTTQRDNEEQFGMVLLEAMCAGLPTIVTDVGGMPYVVKRDKTSIVVEERNVEALTMAMEELIVNWQLRLDMGRNSRKFVESNFHPKVIAGNLDSLYQSLVR